MSEAARAMLPTYEAIVDAVRWDEREKCVSRLYAHASTLDEAGSLAMMAAIRVLEEER